MKLIKLSMFVAAAVGLVSAGAACSSGEGPQGPQGEQGAPGTPGAAEPAPSQSGVSLVTPNKGVLDREIEVQIGGSQTQFKEGAKPNFGDGIEVLEVTASSPTLINARIKISPTAAIGARKVSIGDVAAEGAFTVLPAIEVGGGKASVAQGGLIQMDISNNDTKAFDPQAFFLEVPGLIDMGSQASGPQAAVGVLLAPPLAKTGTSQITVQNLGADGKPKLTFLSASDAFEVTARAATDFVLGTPKVETLAGLDTKLFKLSTPANAAAMVDYRIEVPADGKAVPIAFLFGTGGSADDQMGTVAPSRDFLGNMQQPPYDFHLTVPLAPSASATDHYIVLADLGGKAGATATVTATRAPMSLSAEATAAHAANAPQNLGTVGSASGQLVSANLAAAAEVDAYQFTVTATDKLQLAATSEADVEIVFTKDPNVLADPQGTAPGDRKVLGYLYPGKGAVSQRALTAAVGVTTVYAVVAADPEGKVATGKYTLGLRKLP